MLLIAYTVLPIIRRNSCIMFILSLCNILNYLIRGGNSILILFIKIFSLISLFGYLLGGNHLAKLLKEQNTGHSIEQISMNNILIVNKESLTEYQN